MSVPVNPKYPLFLREINKNKVNNEENNIDGGGYPVVTIEDDFNIEAEPNTFYNIKNSTDTEVNINFKTEELYASGNTVNEFIFNINSPCNIIFNEEIKWNNDNTPDLTQEGICTISILNGVGCYTFVK